MAALLDRVLTTQLMAPAAAGGGDPGRLFLARVDRLLDGGALDRARALLIAAGPHNPEIFRRLFDIALLVGHEAQACEIMTGTPGIAPSFAARIFCLAQRGDWAAASISLDGASTLGLVTPDEALLLSHFLDDALVDGAEQPLVSDRLTPLEFRILEAIGQPRPTVSLPIAFAHADLRPVNGWKARLDAAERLARAGAVPPAALRALYSEQSPAASGGVWDRAAAMQGLETALAAGDALPALVSAFDTFRSAGMADVLAAMIAADLPEDGAGRAGKVAALLRQWQGLSVARPVAPDPALVADPAPAPTTRLGEALLAAMTDVDAGVDGDLARAGRGLAALRALGLASTADLAAAQLTLLPAIRPQP